MLWFHGSILCNWSFWLYISETGSEINCLPWWRNTRKTRHQRPFWSRSVSAGEEWKIVFDSATHTHCIYLVSTGFFEGALQLQQLPQRHLKKPWGEVFPSLNPGAHLKVFRGEWSQIHNRSPSGLPCGAPFETPIINISWVWTMKLCPCAYRENEKRIMYVSLWVMHYYTCVQPPPHPAPCPLTPFSIAWSTCLLQ